MVDRRDFLRACAAAPLGLASAALASAAVPVRVRSRQSGPWSAAGTWEGDSIPGAGSVVQILAGHDVLFDIETKQAIRMVHVLGNLRFAADRNTRLDVGLLKVGGNDSEDGASASHQHSDQHTGQRPVLEVGTAENPIPAGQKAVIRLTYFEGFDRDSLPSLICCGGAMNFHGAPMSRTWLKLGAPLHSGDMEVTLAEPVTGWRAGDRIILTATKRQTIFEETFRDSVRDNTQTEERIIKSISGAKIALDRPVDYEHICDGLYRGDVANLSRNVTIESATPNGERGHTMYHHGSEGAISYAEFRKLGKRNVLGRYMLHFHQVRDSMRGCSVVGASLWDSGNRWMTIHGTDYMVVRDCVGYNSIGHGFFLEDGTEVYNIFDRNLAVQGRNGKIMPNQVLPFDHNSGSGFWWANSLNTFTRNVACECDVYGFRFDMQKTGNFDPVLAVPQPDGKLLKTDVRRLPFVRFEDNEAHCQRNHAFNLGGLDINLEGGCGKVGPDVRHPFVVRNMRVWDSHWSFHTLSPSVVLDNYDIHNSSYGLWKPNIVNHAYRNLHMENIRQDVLLDGVGEMPAVWSTGYVGSRPLFNLNMPATGFPHPLDPVDDLAPVVVATHIGTPLKGRITVRGVASDSGTVKSITVNGHHVRALRPNFAEWEVILDRPDPVLAIRAEDAAGNVSTTNVGARNV